MVVRREFIGELNIVCEAPADFFGRWEDVSPESRALLTEKGSTNCDGGGRPGRWCETCTYCTWYEYDNLEQI